MRISDWSSDVCSSDLRLRLAQLQHADRAGARQRGARFVARNDPHRGAFGARRQPPGACVRGWAARDGRAAVLHQLGVAAVRAAGGDGGGGVWSLSGWNEGGVGKEWVVRVRLGWWLYLKKKKQHT